jgi:hypothetical protein
MCGFTPVTAAMQAKPVQKLVDQTPQAKLYKEVSGGTKVSDAFKDKTAYLGLGSSAMFNRAKNNNQFSMA